MSNKSNLAPLTLIALSLIGCAAAPTTPREYLDEQTAATITAVAEPWILVGEDSSPPISTSLSRSRADRDFLNLYAIDVNRMGDHRQYIAVLQWFPSPDSTSRAPMLELHGDGAPIALQATTEDARALGLAQPVAPSYGESKWWYFPVDKQVLASLARNRNLSATLAAGDKQTRYIIWRDGSAELSELTAVLP